MSKDIYDKLKIFSDLIRDNKTIVILLISMLTANVGQAISGINKSQIIQYKNNEITKIQKQVGDVANSYHKFITKEKKILIIKEPSNCSVCKKELEEHIKIYNDHIERYHN